LPHKYFIKHLAGDTGIPTREYKKNEENRSSNKMRNAELPTGLENDEQRNLRHESEWKEMASAETKPKNKP
jgi:hypothetical protein